MVTSTRLKGYMIHPGNFFHHLLEFIHYFQISLASLWILVGMSFRKIFPSYQHLMYPGIIFHSAGAFANIVTKIRAMGFLGQS